MYNISWHCLCPPATATATLCCSFAAWMTMAGVVQTPVTVQRGFQPGLGWIVGLSARDFVRGFQPGLGWIVWAFVLLSSQAAPARWLPARTGAREEGAAG